MSKCYGVQLNHLVENKYGLYISGYLSAWDTQACSSNQCCEYFLETSLQISPLSLGLFSRGPRAAPVTGWACSGSTSRRTPPWGENLSSNSVGKRKVCPNTKCIFFTQREKMGIKLMWKNSQEGKTAPTFGEKVRIGQTNSFARSWSLYVFPLESPPHNS